MDLLTHIAAGMAAGTTIAVCIKGKAIKKTSVIGAGALGGALPDIDAISLWSKFDATLGRLFNLSHTGKEIYSAKFWYSHHGFMHSLAASLLFAFILMVVVYLARKWFRALSWTDFWWFVRENTAVAAAFILGYLLHLICDMPTPASSWGGVRLLFPLELYVGGWGKIWWWNNYDIFLIVSGVIAANFLILAISGWIGHKIKYLSCVLLIAAVLTVTIQVNNRKTNFNTNSYIHNEAKSKEIQRRILGRKLFGKMEKLDRSIPLYF